MPTFKLVTEEGQWLTDMHLGPPDWNPGDRIHRGRDTLEVVEVREGKVLVVRSRHVAKSE